MRTFARFIAALPLLLASLPALAAGNGVMLAPEPMAGEKVNIDGDLREWPSAMTDLGVTQSGSSVRAGVTLGYDDTNLYVVMKLGDKHIERSAAASENEDHATLQLAFPHGRDFNTYDVDLFPGNPGKTAGVVKMKGSAVSGAKIVEAPSKNGLDFEAQIPWSAFPDAAKVRVGMRAAVSYNDAQGGAIATVVSTSPNKSGRALPPMLLEAEEGLESNLLKPKGLVNPSREAYGNVSGDALVERVAVYGNSLAIVGPHYRGGKEFYVAELAVKDESMVTRLELVDFDGDGHDEIVIQKRIGAPEKYREILTVTKVGSDDTPFQAFATEVGIKTPDGKIENRVSLKGGQIEISQGESEGFDPATYAEPTPGDNMASALLPWENVGTRTFKWTGKGFEPSGETPNSGKGAGGKTAKGPKKNHKKRGAAPSDEPPPPPAPRAPTSDELLDRVYALYRKDRGVGAGKPSFDFVTDVSGDRAPERVLIHGKDIVVFGKGFRGGMSYAFITIGVSDPKDIVDVTARDLTGDGKAEIVVRAVLHAKASKALGGDTVERRALMVYGIKDDALVRVFGAETSRALGDNQVLGAVAFAPGKRGTEIELRPLRALGWTEKSYPFPQDTTPAGGLEPLLLPWGDAGKRSYHWNGSAFVQ